MVPMGIIVISLNVGIFWFLQTQAKPGSVVQIISVYLGKMPKGKGARTLAKHMEHF